MEKQDGCCALSLKCASLRHTVALSVARAWLRCCLWWGLAGTWCRLANSHLRAWSLVSSRMLANTWRSSSLARRGNSPRQGCMGCGRGCSEAGPSTKSHPSLVQGPGRRAQRPGLAPGGPGWWLTSHLNAWEEVGTSTAPSPGVSQPPMPTQVCAPGTPSEPHLYPQVAPPALCQPCHCPPPEQSGPTTSVCWCLQAIAGLVRAQLQVALRGFPDHCSRLPSLVTILASFWIYAASGHRPRQQWSVRWVRNPSSWCPSLAQAQSWYQENKGLALWVS